MKRLRWKLAYLIDRHPRYCWADLVTWALRWHPFREVSRASECGLGPDRSCYCGKVKA